MVSLKNALCVSVGIRILIVIIGMGLVFFRCVQSDNVVPVVVSPMLEAASSGQYDKMKNLLNNGASPNSTDSDGTSSYTLVSNPPPLSLINVGNSALAFAVFNGLYPANRECIDLMLQHQADPRLTNKEGQPPFFWVVKIDFKDIRLQVLGKLIKFGADINVKDDKSYTLLEKIVETYDTTGVDMFLDWWGKLITPETLHAAKERAEQYNLADVLVVLNKKRVMRPVQDEFWNPSTIDARTGMSDLHYAVINNDQALVDACLARKANVNQSSSDEYGMRPLHYAVLHYYPDMVEHLVSKKADVNSTNLYKNSPLHMVAWLDNKSIAKKIADTLLKNGAKLNAKNRDGNTLLHMLIYTNNRELIDYIGSQYEFDLYTKNENRESPLMLAERLERKNLLRKIIKK